MSRARIAVFSGASSTVQNTPPLVTSNQTRRRYGLPVPMGPDGVEVRYDALRPQRLARPVTVYIEQFSAHPLEADAVELYGPPDGYIDERGDFSNVRTRDDQVPVYKVELRPEDGLYPLPYAARQIDGRAWEDDGADPGAPEAASRQPFFPDGARLFEEIDRLAVDARGHASILSRRADFDFHRVLPPGGFRRGQSAEARTDVGSGDIAPEERGQDFFPYRPFHLYASPSNESLANLASDVNRILATGSYAGAIWLEGSPYLEETLYWLSLTVDTTIPLVGVAAQRMHGMIGNDGDRNVIDAVDYILSAAWSSEGGDDLLGPVAVIDQQILTARELEKVDARPGGFRAAGGIGGQLGLIPEGSAPIVHFLPARRFTARSDVRVTSLPSTTHGVVRSGGDLRRIKVHVRDDDGRLLPAAVPQVAIVKTAFYERETSVAQAVDAIVERALEAGDPLTGIVAEGSTPYATVRPEVNAALERAAYCGIPVVRVGRGSPAGPVQADPTAWFIRGSNLSATKARILLTASMLRFGALPPATDRRAPTLAERGAVRRVLDDYQRVFDSH